MSGSWVDDLEASAARLVVDGVEELAAYLWHRIRGDDSEAGRAAVQSIKEKALAAMVETLQLELARQAARADLLAGLAQLTIASGDVLGAFERRGESFGALPMEPMTEDEAEAARLEREAKL